MKRSLLGFLAVIAAAAPAAAADVTETVEKELHRSFDHYSRQTPPLYFLSYSVIETEDFFAQAGGGALSESREDHGRLARVDARVGTAALDSSHPLRDSRGDWQEDPGVSVTLPVENDPLALRSALWAQSDRAYKDAVERWGRVKSQAAVKAEEEDKSPDLSAETPETAIQAPAPLAYDRPAWEEKLRRWSAPFGRAAHVLDSGVEVRLGRESRTIVTSEGTRVIVQKPFAFLILWAWSRAEDGMDLTRTETFFASSPDGLPGEDVVLQAANRMIGDLAALRAAPLTEPYSGPAILSGRAAAVFFHEVLGHPIEGERQRRSDEAQTFAKKRGQKITSSHLSVVFDPTLSRFGQTELAGGYLYDDQGVKARPVKAVEKGIFREFLLSRKPVAGFSQSNGHGRAEPGRTPMARQSNLIVNSDDIVTDKKLKALLLREVRRQKKPYGLLFDDIQGGYTQTTRDHPNAFSVLPILVYRVYPDGREELVRGVDLVGTPLSALEGVLAAGNPTGVFNGFCGAESGQIPVSAVSPSLLFSNIEVQRRKSSEQRPPLLPPPEAKP